MSNYLIFVCWWHFKSRGSCIKWHGITGRVGTGNLYNASFDWYKLQSSAPSEAPKWKLDSKYIEFFGYILSLDNNLEQKRWFRCTISGLRELFLLRFKRLHGAARVKNHKCFISWRAEGAGNLGWVWQAHLFVLHVHTPTHKDWMWILLRL